MAKMYPESGPAPCTKESKEDVVYELLRRKLPNEYVVAHSYHVQRVNRDGFELVEIDFVVFHPRKGLLTIEVKAGTNFEYFEDGAGNADVRRSGVATQRGIHAQAYNAHDCLTSKYRDATGDGYPFGFCKFNYAVWFIDLDRTGLSRIPLPPSIDLACTLTLEDMDDPLPSIERIMDLPRADGSFHRMDDGQAQRFLREFLVPSGMFPSEPERENSVLGRRLFELTESQRRVIEYLRFERVAAVTGIGGTGKSVIAKEYALRRAREGKKVLYLCYNALFGDSLAEEFASIKNITAMTVDACASLLIDPKSTGHETLESWEASERKNRYSQLALELVDAKRTGGGKRRRDRTTFEFDDLIIDEAQDFSKPGMEDVLDVMLALYEDETVSDNGEGTLFFFYDELQVVPGARFPERLRDVKCRLALYVNCRNSEEIARLGLNALDRRGTKGLVPKSLDGATGHVPTISFVGPKDGDGGASPSEYAEKIDEEIEKYKAIGINEKDITVVTCASANGTRLSSYLTEKRGLKYWQDSWIRFETVRRFKGLESDAVILVEVDESAWMAWRDDSDSKLGALAYVGATRAKRELSVILDMSHDECNKVLRLIGANIKNRRGRAALERCLVNGK